MPSPTLMLSVLSVAAILAAALACSAPSAPTPEPTPNIDATVSAEVEARLAAAPTATPYPTATPRPTYPPPPPRVVVATATPEPTPSPTPRPTIPPPTPFFLATLPPPTPTPALIMPVIPKPVPPQVTPPPTPSASEWEGTGDWYRDHDYEAGLKMAMEALGQMPPIGVATLDASARATFQDLSLSLGCIGPTKVAYLTPYVAVPAGADTYTFGVWNTSASEWESGQVLRVSNPGFTDDGSAVYIYSQAQVREILAIIRQADANQAPGLVLSGGIFVDGADDDSGVWGDFVPAGYEDALDYLPCF